MLQSLQQTFSHNYTKDRVRLYHLHLIWDQNRARQCFHVNSWRYSSIMQRLLHRHTTLRQRKTRWTIGKLFFLSLTANHDNQKVSVSSCQSSEAAKGPCQVISSGSLKVLHEWQGLSLAGFHRGSVLTGSFPFSHFLAFHSSLSLSLSGILLKRNAEMSWERAVQGSTKIQGSGGRKLKNVSCSYSSSVDRDGTDL